MSLVQLLMKDVTIKDVEFVRVWIWYNCLSFKKMSELVLNWIRVSNMIFYTPQYFRFILDPWYLESH